MNYKLLLPLLCAFSVSSFSADNPKTDVDKPITGREFCDNYTAIAKNIMASRQNNFPIADLKYRVEHNPALDQVYPDFKKVMISLQNSLVDMAYEVPVYQSKDIVNNVINDFGVKNNKSCEVYLMPSFDVKKQPKHKK